MKARDKDTNQQRRNFLRGSVAAGAGVALSASTVGITAARTQDEQAKQVKSKKAGYQLSQHILEYYKTCAR